jgi:hypothetical protein
VTRLRLHHDAWCWLMILAMLGVFVALEWLR